MNPYKHILDSEKVLKTLVNDAKTMDNTKTRLSELNTLIRLVNSYKKLLEKKYFTDYFDILLLSSMYNFFLINKTYESNTIPIRDFLLFLDTDVRYGRNYHLQSIIGLLQGCERIKTPLINSSDEDWREIIENTLLQIKKQIKFKEKIQ